MKILIIAPSWIGDLVIAQALAITLKKLHGEIKIDILARPWCIEVAQRMPQINQVIKIDLKHGKLNLATHWRIGRTLATSQYTHAFILPNSFKSALIPWFAHIPKRIGYTGEARYSLINHRYTLDKIKYPQIVQRFIALAYPPHSEIKDKIVWPQLNLNHKNIAQIRQNFSLPFLPYLALCPGAAFGKSKRWPVKNFIQFASLKITQGWHILLLGSTNEIKITSAILKALPREAATNLAGKISLIDTIDIIGAAKLVITNDSGLMHIAAAVNTPLIAIYGSTSPSFTPPLTSRAKILNLDLVCSPCYKRTCKFGHYNCLNNITVNMVADAAEVLLAQSSK